MKFRNFIWSIVLVFFPFWGMAQSETAQATYPKLEVVLGVILIIFAWIMFYLIRLDAKVSALEKQNKDKA